MEKGIDAGITQLYNEIVLYSCVIKNGGKKYDKYN